MTGRKPTYILLVLLLCGPVCDAAETDKPAKLKVSGYGLFGNRELKGLLSVLQVTEERPKSFEANYVEDAVLVLFSRLGRDGYLFPQSTLER